MRLMNKHKVFTLVALVGLLMSLMPATVLATHSDEGGVSATVTPSFISLTLSTNSVTYGTQSLGDTGEEPDGMTCGTGPVGGIEVTNNGTASENFLIKGANSVSGGWQLGSSATTDVYVHRFSTNPTTCDYTALQNGNQTLGSTVAIDDSFLFFLNLDMPTHSTANDEQTLPITVTATN